MPRLPYILALALLAPACTNPGKCGEGDSDRCIEPTESDSATDPSPSGTSSTGGDGSTGPGSPTTTGEPTTTTDTTTGTPAGLMRCTPTCSVDADCTYNGTDIDFKCIDGVCGFPACTADGECQALFSGWSEPCMNANQCMMGEACVDIGGGEGRCARQPGRDFKCDAFGLVELTRPALGGGDVAVCGTASAFCDEGTCTSPCKSDTDCNAEQGTPFCQVDTGVCTCATDNDCSSTLQPGFTRCVEGRCGCNDDSDCVGGNNVDTCVAGSCGCSSTAACDDPFFDDAILVCEPA